MRPTMSFISLPVEDLDAARAFYGQLGWSPLRSGADHVFYALDGLVLALVAPARLQAEGAAPGSASSVLLSHNVADEATLDATIHAFCAAGGHLLRAKAPTPWPGARALAADPCGLRWELVWNPRAQPTAAGGLTLGARNG